MLPRSPAGAQWRFLATEASWDVSRTHPLAEPIGFAEILANARAITPYLAEKSAAIEQARQLPPEVVETLKKAGAFRMAMPRAWGGPELTSMEQVEVIEQLSMGDASVGWCVMIGCDSGLYSGFVEASVARSLWPELDMVQAGWVYPMGRADLVDNGYQVSGRWISKHRSPAHLKFELTCGPRCSPRRRPPGLRPNHRKSETPHRAA